MPQLAAVKHALLRADYRAMEARTNYPIALIEQLAEVFDYDLGAVERHVNDSMQAVAAILATSFTETLHGGNAGGGKQDAMFLYRHHYAAQAVAPAPLGVVTTCVS